MSRSRLKSGLRFGFLGLFVALALTGCAPEPFVVSPRVEVRPDRFPHQTEAATLKISALPLGEADVLSRFDGNLLLAEVLPVHILLENRGATNIAFNKLRLRILEPSGRDWPKISVKKAVTRQMDYHGIRAYSVEGFKIYRAKFESHALPESTVLAPGTSAQGLVFFRIRKHFRDHDQPLTLEVGRVPGTLEPVRVAVRIP